MVQSWFPTSNKFCGTFRSSDYVTRKWGYIWAAQAPFCDRQSWSGSKQCDWPTLFNPVGVQAVAGWSVIGCLWYFGYTMTFFHCQPITIEHSQLELLSDAVSNQNCYHRVRFCEGKYRRKKWIFCSCKSGSGLYTKYETGVNVIYAWLSMKNLQNMEVETWSGLTIYIYKNRVITWTRQIWGIW